MITDSAVQSASPVGSSSKPSPQPPGDAAEHVVHSLPASPAPSGFADLGLPEPLLRAVIDEGYTQPTAIQALAIPLLLQGRDVIGQAQTGTGKTAAFSLPLLQRIDPQVQAVQALVLVPTRELALQVATAVHTYAKFLPRITVLPIFGGDSMDRQMARLHRGIHVVVGTPGRILDHIRRGSLDLSHVGFLVLDEADEMLRMGFLEDVETILSKTPETRQTTLLSATMPSEIRRVSRSHLRNPEHVAAAAQAMTVASTRQCVAIVPENLKQEVVARILETDEPEAALIFTRTRIGASELAEQLTERGFPAEALHSDMSQAQRLTVLQRLRDRRAQVVVATDVAARGLDIDHISHVINYDLPAEAETYVHRIGRTGRAGRAGLAVLLATPYQRPILRNIERYTQRPLELLPLPTLADVARKRRERLKAALLATAAKETLDGYRELCAETAEAGACDPVDVAVAALRLLTNDRPLFGDTKAYDPLARLAHNDRRPDHGRAQDPRDRDRGPAPFRGARPGNDGPPSRPDSPRGPRRDSPRPPQENMARVQLAVGHRHGVRPGDLVGAIANEAGIAGRDIGRVEIRDHESIVEIPAAAMQRVLTSLQNTTVRGEAARPRMVGDAAPGTERERPQQRTFNDAAPSADRERPPRTFNNSAPSTDRERPPRTFNDAAPSADRERPPRTFNNSAPSTDRERPPRPSNDSAPSVERERPPRAHQDAPPAAERKPPPRPYDDLLPDLESERAQRPRPIPAPAPPAERERKPRPRPAYDAAPATDRERPPRPYSPSSSGPSADRERPPRPRPFNDSAPSSDRDRPPRPRPFNDSAPSSDRPSPPRSRSFNDSSPSAERAPRPYSQKSEPSPRPSDPSSRPSDAPQVYRRPPPPSRATSWTWGSSAPSTAPTGGRPDAAPPSAPGRGEQPPKRRPH